MFVKSEAFLCIYIAILGRIDDAALNFALRLILLVKDFEHTTCKVEPYCRHVRVRRPRRLLISSYSHCCESMALPPAGTPFAVLQLPSLHAAARGRSDGGADGPAALRNRATGAAAAANSNDAANLRAFISYLSGQSGLHRPKFGHTAKGAVVAPGPEAGSLLLFLPRSAQQLHGAC